MELKYELRIISFDKVKYKGEIRYSYQTRCENKYISINGVTQRFSLTKPIKMTITDKGEYELIHYDVHNHEEDDGIVSIMFQTPGKVYTEIILTDCLESEVMEWIDSETSGFNVILEQ